MVVVQFWPGNFGLASSVVLGEKSKYMADPPEFCAQKMEIPHSENIISTLRSCYK